MQNNILLQWTRGRCESFFSSTCRPPLKRLITERFSTDFTPSLAWGAVHLTGCGRHRVVSIRGEHSDTCWLSYGVPQGSVLGPQLFTVYTSPLGRNIRAHGFDYHLFADDSQLYVIVKPVQAYADGATGRLD